MAKMKKRMREQAKKLAQEREQERLQRGDTKMRRAREQERIQKGIKQRPTLAKKRELEAVYNSRAESLAKLLNPIARSQELEAVYNSRAESLSRLYGFSSGMALQIAKGYKALETALREQQERNAKPKLGQTSTPQQKLEAEQVPGPTQGQKQTSTLDRERVQGNDLEGSERWTNRQTDVGLAPTYDVYAVVERRKNQENRAFRPQILIDKPLRGTGGEREKEREQDLAEQEDISYPPPTREVSDPVPLDDGVTLDEFSPQGSLPERLHKINTKMAGISPEQVRSVVSQTIRRDTQLIKALKAFYQFRCQFPGCNIRIPKRGGGFYIEVAHIQPVREGGRSVLGNLLVLCPNHHKEFDYGDLEIQGQAEDWIRGRLNGREFEIRQPKSSSSLED